MHFANWLTAFMNIVRQSPLELSLVLLPIVAFSYWQPIPSLIVLGVFWVAGLAISSLTLGFGLIVFLPLAGLATFGVALGVALKFFRQAVF